MKYIGIGMIWLAVAIMVSTIAFATNDGGDAFLVGAVGSVAAVVATAFITDKIMNEREEE